MKIAIIGGGAGGLAAAYACAEHAQVTIYEKQPRLGRKLLATGNGRCNLTNRHAAPNHYHGADVSFCAPALERFGVDDTLAWLEENLDIEVKPYLEVRPEALEGTMYY